MIANHRRRVNQLLSQHAFATKTVKEEKKKLAEAKEHEANVQLAQQTAQSVAAEVQQHAHAQITSIVSKCLSSIFEDPYEFKINFERKRGKTEARLSFVRDGHERNPLRGAGGGVADLASLALRIASITLSKPAVRKLLVADEPAKHLSHEYHDKVRMLLETLTKELGFQLIIVTHSTDLAAGKIIDMENI